MLNENVSRVEQQWATLFGCRPADLWHGMHVAPHAEPVDDPGILVAARGGGWRVSTLTWLDASERESLSLQGETALLNHAFWSDLRATSGMAVLGPSLHAYTDVDPGAVSGVDRTDLPQLAALWAAITPSEWSEGGFQRRSRRLLCVARHNGL